MNKKSVVILGTLLVAAVIGFVAWKGIYPPRTGVEGTIGAANRYQSQQISESDVVLQDASIQAFLQTDTFRKIAANPEFIKAAENAVAVELFKNEAFRKSAKSLEFQEAMKSEAFRGAAESGRLAGITKIAEMRSIMESKQFEAFAAEAARKKPLTIVEMKAIMEDAKYEAIRNSEAWRSVSENAQAMELLASPGMMEALSVSHEFLVSEAGREVVEMQQFQEMAKNAEFANLVAEAAWVEALSVQEFNQILEAGSIREALTAAEAAVHTE